MNFIKNLPVLLGQNQGIKQTVFKNTFWLSFGQIVSKIIKFVLIIYAARILGSADYGSFAYILSFVSLAFMFSDLGISVLMIREYNKLETNKSKLLINTLYTKIFLVAVSSILTIALAYFVKDPIAKSALIFIILMYVIDSTRDVFLGLARAKEKMEIESTALIVSAVTTSILGIWFLLVFASVKTLGIAYLLGSVSSFFVTILLIIKLLPGILQKPDLFYIKKILSTAWPFAFGFIIAAILTSTDTVMLGFMKTPEMVGHYSVGVRIVQILLTLPAFLSVALLPNLSKYIQEKDRIKEFIQKGLAYIMMLGIPLFVGGILVAPDLIPKLFGIQYQAGVISFQILLFLIIIVFPVVIFDYLLLALDKQIKNFQYTSMAAICNVLFNFILIPRYGLYGAAVATVLAQIINLILTTNLVKKTLGAQIIPYKNLSKFLIASGIMALIIWLGFNWHFNLWMIMIVAAISYFLFLYIIKEKRFKELISLLKS